MIATRRKFITGLAALVAAPAVIRFSGIMPVNAAQASPFAMIRGLDLTGREVVHKLWEPMSVNQFAGTEMFRNMSMVNSWEYAKPVVPLAPPPFVLDDKTVDQIIEERILKREQQRQTWRDSLAIGWWGNDKTTAAASQLRPFKNGTPDLQIFDGNNLWMQKNHGLQPVTSAKEEWFRCL